MLKAYTLARLDVEGDSKGHSNLVVSEPFYGRIGQDDSRALRLPGSTLVPAWTLSLQNVRD